MSQRLITDKMLTAPIVRNFCSRDGCESWVYLESPACYVSDQGRIAQNKSLVPLKQYSAGRKTDPYRYVYLSVWGQRRLFCVHRLVARAWLGPKPPGCEVHHKDHDRFNNAASNLEYVTSSQNKLHAVANGYRGERRYNAILTETIVREAKEKASHGWKPKQIAEHFGISKTAIRHALAGRTWKHVT